jgi:hypothetical protein
MTAEPPKLTKAGPLTIDASFTEDVEEIELYAGDQLLETLTPDQLAHDFIVTSAELNGQHDVWIRAVDDGGLADDSEPVAVTVALPESGSTVWKMIGDDPDIVHGHAITPFAEGVAIGGAKVKQGWSTAMVRYYDETNTLRWTASPVNAEGMTVALTLAPDGGLIAVGQMKKGQGFAPWLAKFDSLANITLGPIIGNTGETATGVAAAPTGEIYVSGYIQTAGEGKFDAMLWAYSADGEPSWSEQWENPAGDKPGRWTNKAHAVAVLHDGSIATVGSTEVADPNMPDTKEVTRILAQRYGQGGALLSTWIAESFPALESEGLAVSAEATGDLVIGGWSSELPTEYREAMTVKLSGPNYTPEWFRVEMSDKSGFEQVEGLARLPGGAVVLGRTSSSETTDLEVTAFLEPYAPPLWSRTHSPADQDERCTDLALGPFGAIYYLGISAEERFVAGELAP